MYVCMYLCMYVYICGVIVWYADDVCSLKCFEYNNPESYLEQEDLKFMYVCMYAYMFVCNVVVFFSDEVKYFNMGFLANTFR